MRNLSQYRGNVNSDQKESTLSVKFCIDDLIKLLNQGSSWNTDGANSRVLESSLKISSGKNRSGNLLEVHNLSNPNFLVGIEKTETEEGTTIKCKLNPLISDFLSHHHHWGIPYVFQKYILEICGIMSKEEREYSYGSGGCTLDIYDNIYISRKKDSQEILFYGETKDPKSKPHTFTVSSKDLTPKKIRKSDYSLIINPSDLENILLNENDFPHSSFWINGVTATDLTAEYLVAGIDLINSFGLERSDLIIERLGFIFAKILSSDNIKTYLLKEKFGVRNINTISKKLLRYFSGNEQQYISPDIERLLSLGNIQIGFKSVRGRTGILVFMIDLINTTENQVIGSYKISIV